MGLYENLVEKALPLARAKRIKRMVAGIHYTMVEIERGEAGLAYTLLKEIKNCCPLGDEINFWKSPADIIIKGYLSPNPLEVCVGLATINAIFASYKNNLKNVVYGDIFSEIKLTENDEILMIGYFEPLIKRLQGGVKKIWILEEKTGEKPFNIIEIKHKIKVAIVTASTLVNKTLEDILDTLYGIKEVILMGPSTPLCPEVFKYTPITWLSGALVEDTELLFRKICEGKGAQTFFKSGLLKKINLKVKK